MSRIQSFKILRNRAASMTPYGDQDLWKVMGEAEGLNARGAIKDWLTQHPNCGGDWVAIPASQWEEFYGEARRLVTVEAKDGRKTAA